MTRKTYIPSASPAMSAPKEYQELFDGDKWLSVQYVDTDEVLISNGAVLKGLHELYSGGANGLKIIEIGCGPVVTCQISAAPFASEIVLADLVKSNRDSVQLWLDKSPDAHDWTPFFRYVVQTLEGKGEEEIARREEQLRKAVKAVIYCDLLEDPPVPPGYEGPNYDVVLETGCLNSVCKNEADLIAGLVRLWKLIKPGGRLVSKVYLAEGIPTGVFPYQIDQEGTQLLVMAISEKLFQGALIQAGFSDISITKAPPLAKRTKEIGATYYGIAFVSAVKAK